jgi:hypothetical protein
LSNLRVPSARSSISSLAIGISLGVLVGLGISFAFFLIIVGPLLGLGLGLAALTSGMDDRPQAHVGGGWLIGTGSLYLLEAFRTLNSCQGQDVCGGASAVPFLGYAVAVLAVGLVIEGITVARQT